MGRRQNIDREGRRNRYCTEERRQNIDRGEETEHRRRRGDRIQSEKGRQNIQ
jgi:hypothetical protein